MARRKAQTYGSALPFGYAAGASRRAITAFSGSGPCFRLTVGSNAAGSAIS